MKYPDFRKKNYQIWCSHEEVIPTTKVSSRLKRKGWCHIQWGAPIGVDHSGLQPLFGRQPNGHTTTIYSYDCKYKYVCRYNIRTNKTNLMCIHDYMTCVLI